MWFIRFSVLCVHEYCHHVYSLTITNQSLFSFYSHLNIFFFYYKFNFMLQILINIFWPIKIKIKSFRFCYENHVFLHYWLDWTFALDWTFLVILLGHTRDIIFVWFHFLVCMNCFWLLFVLIILEVLLIVCLELKFLIFSF